MGTGMSAHIDDVDRDTQQMESCTGRDRLGLERDPLPVLFRSDHSGFWPLPQKVWRTADVIGVMMRLKHSDQCLLPLLKGLNDGLSNGRIW